MSYFDPEVYNEENLKEDDLNEIKFWRYLFDCALENTRDYPQAELDLDEDSLTGKITQEFVDKILDNMEQHFESMISEYVVSKLDSYPGEDLDDNAHLINKE